jgi:hypothetical protein
LHNDAPIIDSAKKRVHRLMTIDAPMRAGF